MNPFRFILLVLFAASLHADPLDAPPSAAELREWIYPKVHSEYRRAVDRAIRQEPAGLAELFRYTVTGEVDGAAGEAHAAVLFGLLQRWGDRRFSDVLRMQKPPIRKAVIDTLPLPPGSRQKFPRTSAAGRR
jgi:hypothetical protein